MATPETEDLNTPMIAVSGVIGAVIVFFMIVGLQVWYYNAEQAENYRKVVAPAAEELSSVVAGQQGQLNSYRAIDPKNKIVAIPIDRAMELVVRDLAEGRSPLSPTTQATATQPTSSASQPGGASHER